MPSSWRCHLFPLASSLDEWRHSYPATDQRWLFPPHATKVTQGPVALREFVISAFGLQPRASVKAAGMWTESKVH